MSRTQARIFTSIWHNEEFLSMRASAQRLFMLALSQESLSFCGVVDYTAKRWAKLASDTTVKSIHRDVSEAARTRFVVVDEDTEEIWVRTLMRHDGVFKSPNLVLGMIRDLDAVHSTLLSDAIYDSIHDEFPGGFRRYLITTFPTGFPRGFPEAFCQDLEKRFGEPLPEELHTHAGAGVSSVHHPSTSLLLDPSPEGSPEGSARRSNGQAPWSSDPLVQRWCHEVTRNTRSPHQAETWRVVTHLRQFVDEGTIDATIGRCARLDKRPTKPAYLLTSVTNEAAQQGIEVPPLEGTRQ